MTPEDFKNLQNEVLRLTQRLIALENAKPTDYSLVFQSIRAQIEQLEKRADNYGARLNILENARHAQIKINDEVIKLLKNPEPKQETKIFSWFGK